MKLSKTILGLVLLLTLTAGSFTTFAATSYFKDSGNYIAPAAGSGATTVFDFASNILPSDFTINGVAIDSYDSDKIELGFIYDDGTDLYCFGSVIFEKVAGVMKNTGGSIFADDALTPELDGYPTNATITVNVYDHTASKLYEVCSFSAEDISGTELSHTFASVFYFFTSVHAYGNAVPVSPAIGAVATASDVTLEWTDLNTAATAYKIYVNTSNDFENVTPTTVLDSDAAWGNTKSLTGLTAGQQYFWRVDAKLGANYVTGNVGNFWVEMATPVITSPTDMAKDLRTEDFVVAFNTVYGAESYDVCVLNASSVVIGTANVEESPANIATLDAAFEVDYCSDYTITIQAKNTSGNTSQTGSIAVMTIPGMVTATAPMANATKVALTPTFTWDAIDCATNYTFQLFVAGAETAFFTKSGIINTTTYTLTTVLDPYTNYEWAITAYNGTVEGADATMTPFRTEMDCFDITSITPANGAIQISTMPSFTWAAVTGATQYTITVKDANDVTILTDNTNTNSYAWTAGALDLETPYYWTIKSSDGSTPAEEIECGQFTFTTKMPSPDPLTPANNAICIATSGTFTWAAFTNATQYEIQYKASSEDWTNATSMKFGPTVTTWDYSGTTFARAASYDWKIQAFKNGVWTGWSEVNTFTTVEMPLAIVSPIVGEKGLDNTSVTLTVGTPAYSSSAYTFDLATDMAFTNMVSTTTVAATAATFPGLATSTQYYWRAYNDMCGADDADEATVASFITIPTAVTLQYPATGATEVAANDEWRWSASQHADGYEVIYGNTAANMNKSIFANTSATDFVALEASTEYFWNVRPYQVTSDGSKAYGAYAPTPFSFTTKALGPPVIVSPAHNAINQMLDVMLTWQEDDDAIFYGLQVALDDQFLNTLVDKSTPNNNLTQTSFLLENSELQDMKYGKTIYWRLFTAIDDGHGDPIYSSWSSAYKFTIIPSPAIDGKVAICNSEEFNTVTYTTAAIPGVTYTWILSDGGVFTDDGNAFDESADITWTTSGTHTVTVTRSSDSWNEWDLINNTWKEFTDNSTTGDIAVNTPGNFDIAIDIDDYEQTGDTTYCVNERITFTATFTDASDFTYPDDMYTYYWTIEDIDSEDTENMMTTTTYSNVASDYTWAVAGTYDVTFYAISNETNCLAYETTFPISISDECDITIALDQDAEICEGAGETQLLSYVYGGNGSAYNYAWSPCSRFVTCNVANPSLKRTYQNFSFTVEVTDDANNYASSTNSTTMLYKPYPSVARAVIISHDAPATFDLENSEIATRIIKDWDNESASRPNVASWENASFNIITNNVVLNTGINRFYLTMFNYEEDCYNGPTRVIVYKKSRKGTTDFDFTAGMNGTAFMYAYPNPCVNNLNIKAEFADATVANLSIVNIEGNTVKSFASVTGTTIEQSYNVEDLQTGTYFFLLETNDDTIVWKFIKQ